MKKELQPDTSEYLLEIENSLIKENLIPVSSVSKLGKLFNSLFKKFPPRYLIPTTLALSAIASACSFDAGNQNNPDSSQPTPIPTPIEDVPDHNPEIINPRRFLSLPFSESSNIKIQQGWVYTYSDNAHQGIDYINGQLDKSSTWNSFPVLAAAEGDACEPTNKQGNAVFIEHNVNGEIMRTYYGHLKEAIIELPKCTAKERTHVKSGEQIGTAGATGVKNEKGEDEPTWIHLHFQVNDADDNPIDPYDLNTIRDSYPDPKLSNGKVCGKNTLWIKCPTPPISSGAPIENGQINLEVRYADNLPVLNSNINLYKQEEDINGDPILGEKVDQRSTGSTGQILFDTPPGNYVLLFAPYGGTQIYGENFRPDVSNPGLSEIKVEKGKTNEVAITLGRITINNINEWEGKQLDDLVLFACAYAGGANDKLYEVVCRDPNDLGEERLDLFPGDYVISYHWWNYRPTIGEVTLKSGQSLTFTCRTYKPTTFNPPAKCD